MHIKSLTLVAMAAAALVATLGVGAAAATELYNGATTMGAGSTLDLSLKSGTSVTLTETGGGELDKCTASTWKTKITSAGSSTTTNTSENTALTWESCTFPTKTVTLGKQEIHWITGTTIGTVTSDSEIGWTINTIFFGSCVYGVAAGTHEGTFTGNVTPSVMDLNEIVVKREGSAFACPETAKVTATYVVTEPSGAVRVEAS